MLVRRSRELLETEINHFTLIERDGTVIACAAIFPFEKDAMAELACVAVHPDYQGKGFGDTLLQRLEQMAVQQGIETLFVLTTVSSHWFQERGFRKGEVQSLPMARRSLYNYRRNSRVLVKQLD